MCLNFRPQLYYFGILKFCKANKRQKKTTFNLFNDKTTAASQLASQQMLCRIYIWTA